jgi:hypothetical protein
LDSNRKTSLAAGILYLITFVSIPTLALYNHLHELNYIPGPGPDAPVILGGILEIIVALAGIGTAVALYPVVKRQGVLNLRFDDVQALLKDTICLAHPPIGQKNKVDPVLVSENMRSTRQPNRGVRPQPPLTSGPHNPRTYRHPCPHLDRSVG